MKIMCDTNVIVDVLTGREPFIEDSYKILKLCEERNFANPVINWLSTILSSFYHLKTSIYRS